MTGWTESGMEAVLAVIAGVLTAAAVYLMLNRSLVRFLFGLMLLGNAANIVIFASGRLTLASPPLIGPDAAAPVGEAANALPQALILTAIVIGFGLLSFVMVLTWRAYVAMGTIDTDAMRAAELEDDDDEPAWSRPDRPTAAERPARPSAPLPQSSAAGS